jgi:hypothetical protein
MRSQATSVFPDEKQSPRGVDAKIRRRRTGRQRALVASLSRWALELQRDRADRVTQRTIPRWHVEDVGVEL